MSKKVNPEKGTKPRPLDAAEREGMQKIRDHLRDFHTWTVWKGSKPTWNNGKADGERPVGGRPLLGIDAIQYAEMIDDVLNPRPPGMVDDQLRSRDIATCYRVCMKLKSRRTKFDAVSDAVAGVYECKPGTVRQLASHHRQWVDRELSAERVTSESDLLEKLGALVCASRTVGEWIKTPGGVESVLDQVLKCIGR